MSVDELLRGMIVQSGNDASIALAELVGGSEEAFVARMNAEAARLGMTNTRFTNATGLVRPAALLDRRATSRSSPRALIRDYPEYYPLYSQKEFRYNNITQPNRNRLLWTDPYVDGMKTGHTEAAGWCLIASAHARRAAACSPSCSARAPTRRARPRAQKLLNWGFQAFDTVQLYQSGKPVTTLRVWKGATPEVPRGLPRRPLPDAAEGQGRQARADAGGAGAAGRAGRARRSASARSRSRSKASRSPSFR